MCLHITKQNYLSSIYPIQFVSAQLLILIFITPVSFSSAPALSDLTLTHLVTILKITPTPLGIFLDKDFEPPQNKRQKVYILPKLFFPFFFWFQSGKFLPYFPLNPWYKVDSNKPQKAILQPSLILQLFLIALYHCVQFTFIKILFSNSVANINFMRKWLS